MSCSRGVGAAHLQRRVCALPSEQVREGAAAALAAATVAHTPRQRRVKIDATATAAAAIAAAAVVRRRGHERLEKGPRPLLHSATRLDHVHRATELAPRRARPEASQRG